MTTPQTFAITVPYASSQLALGRCACPDGASLTTVGSALLDAAGTLTAQSDGAFVAQTNAAMSWLSQAGTQAHSQAKVEVFAGGGTAPGACGSGMPAASPGSSTPAKTSEAVVNVTLSAASLARNVIDGRAAEGFAGVGAQVLDGIKNVGEGLAEGSKLVGGGASDAMATAGKSAPYAEIASGLVGGLALLSGDASGLDKLATGLGSAATVASGAAGAAGAGADLEERAVAEIKMVAGTMISGSAAIGYDFKTLNKFGVTAGALTSFTTVAWGAFCLLKFEVKAGWAVKAQTKLFSVHASKSATMDAKAMLTFVSPVIDYKSKLEVTKTLDVVAKTTVNSLEVKNQKKSTLHGDLEVRKNMVIHQDLTIKKNLDAKKEAKVSKKTKVKGSATHRGKAKIA